MCIEEICKSLIDDYFVSMFYRGVGAWNFEICVPRIFSRISLEDMRARICVASSHASSHIICVLAYCFIVVGVFWFSVKSVSPSSVRTKNDPYKLTRYLCLIFNHTQWCCNVFVGHWKENDCI